MSRETYEKIRGSAAEVVDRLEGRTGVGDGIDYRVIMPYDVAVEIETTLRAVMKMAIDLQEEHQEEVRGLTEVIEGLVANWPDTEVIEVYKPSATRPVLMKDEALKRARRVMHFANLNQ